MILLISLFLAVAPQAQDLYVAQEFDHLKNMPGFKEQLLTKHFQLYESYVKNINGLLLQLKKLANHGFSVQYGLAKRRLSLEFNGMRLHELYFGNLGGKGNTRDAPHLVAALSEQYGNFDKWKRDFIGTCLMRGIGWAILYRDPIDGRLVNIWISEQDTGHLATAVPLLILDLFEHAYKPQFGLNREKYVNACFANLDWAVLEQRFAAVTASLIAEPLAIPAPTPVEEIP